MNSWRIGNVTITRVVEIEATGGMSRVLPDATRDAVKEIPWLMPHFVSEEGRMRGSIHALVVETPDRRIIVDTCVGNDKERSNPAWSGLKTSFLDDLESRGFPRESIDTVLCTHLHIDHVGWNTMLRDGSWVPTFPHARYLLGEGEVAFWKDTDDPAQQTVYADSVQPVFDAGLVDLVTNEQRICDEVRLVPTPGHTPGHASVLVVSQGEEALITGDFLHHPCQFARPHWCSSFDEDRTQAVATRRAMFEKLADTPTLVIGTHFATPTAGHLVRDGDAYRLNV